MITLYDYVRSSACYRVRIALNLKNVPYELQQIHLVNNGGEQLKEDYLKVNPQGLVPALFDSEKNILLTQSLSIIEYLDETYPTPALLPKDPTSRAQVRSLALSVACEIHPLNNLRVLKYLTGTMGLNEENKNAWYHHWITLGFVAFENRLQQFNKNSAYCFENSPSLADIVLVPQVFNALRFNVPLNDFPLIKKVYEHCLQHPAFIKAAPVPA